MKTFTCLLILFAVSSAFAQQLDVPLPPKPAGVGNGPSLADTMKFIEERLNSTGPVSFINYTHNNITGTDGTSKLTYEMTNVRAGAEGCRIDYHIRLTVNEKVGSDRDVSFSLKDAHEVMMTTEDQSLKEANSKRGNPETAFRTDPPVFSIFVKGKNAGLASFKLYDGSLANRITTALLHAVELCGGGSKEPF